MATKYNECPLIKRSVHGRSADAEEIKVPSCNRNHGNYLCFGFVRGSVLWFPSGFCALVSFGVLCFGFLRVLICYHLTSFLSRVLFYPTSCSSPLSFDTISALLSCVLHTISALSLYNFCSVIPVLSSVPFLFALLSLIFLSSLSVISVR